jgi:hypothetical protein
MPRSVPSGPDDPRPPRGLTVNPGSATDMSVQVPDGLQSAPYPCHHHEPITMKHTSTPVNFGEGT